jgi:hypothetical protein
LRGRRGLRIAGFKRAARVRIWCDYDHGIGQIAGLRVANKPAAFCKEYKDSNVRGKVTAGGFRMELIRIGCIEIDR